MSRPDVRTYEVTFCSRVAKWGEEIFRNNPSLPYCRIDIEESKGIRLKRSDLRVYDRQNKLVLAGEVKMPGTPEGQSPFNAALVEDAFLKASNSGAPYFFTWNVNQLLLFDSSLWEKPLSERRVADFDLGIHLTAPGNVEQPDVEEAVKQLLTRLFTELAEIASGKRERWGMAPDEFFIRAFESHIDYPVQLTIAHLLANADKDKVFDASLQEWMGKDLGWSVVRHDREEWAALVDRAARTLCYVFSNRLLFYESVRAKFSELDALSVPKSVKEPLRLYAHFQKLFQQAVEATGDYETLFYPFEREKDWAGPLIFAHEESQTAWRSVIQNLQPFNFKLIPTDILGGIFKRIIEPEERHKFGQHYTNEDLADVINAFCIRKATDRVLDPACGSASFLVRAYQRKGWMQPNLRHDERLAQLFGSDISLFAAHLATLNLAARDIRDEENYPRIARRNFFEMRPDLPFCILPTGLRDERRKGPIFMEQVEAVVGNPPYVRQELIPKRGDRGVGKMQAKEDLQDLCTRLWPDLILGGRSDLHCYFWPAAARYLPDGGWFGFLVSSSWLDVEYGFALQGWALTNFKVHAILESTAEPWFTDARVKTCAVIMQRCNDKAERDANLVKFVRLTAPLRAILGDRPDEPARQKAADRFRNLILRATEQVQASSYRIIVRPQSELWADGVRAGKLFASQKMRDATPGVKSAGTADDEDDETEESTDPFEKHITPSGYGGGKWGKYLRAPDLYFDIMRRFGKRFVPLGEIAAIRRGITSGCDKFFMPWDVTADYLEKYDAKTWKNAPLHSHCDRADLESGKVKLVEDGNQVVHPIESRYLAPEVHSLMSIKRPVVSSDELDRLILLVAEPLEQLKDSYVRKYIHYGEKLGRYSSKKSKAVPLPKRSTCAARVPWYDLTNTKRGHLVWSKSQQYRHIVMFNENQLIVNCNLYDVTVLDESKNAAEITAAVLNSTLVAFFKFFFGRFAGTEGNLKTEVVDVNLLEVPDPRGVTAAVAAKLRDAFRRLCQRDTMPLVEREFVECRSPERAANLVAQPVSLPEELRQQDRRDLDLAVLEMLGVSEAAERARLCDELYRETALHFRHIRIMEIQKQEQRGKTDNREFRMDELAGDLWDGLPDDEKITLRDWLTPQVQGGMQISIPEGRPHLVDASDMLDATAVFFTFGAKAQKIHDKLTLPTRAHAELVNMLAAAGVHGAVALPTAEKEARVLSAALLARLQASATRAQQLANSRTSDAGKAEELADLLQSWLLHGKPAMT